MTVRATISPLKQEISAKAGDAIDLKIKLTNLGDEPINFRLLPEPLTVSGVDYEVSFNVSTNRTKIVDWVKFPQGDSFVLSGRETREVPFRLEIPTDAPAGGQYAVIAAQFWPTNLGANLTTTTIGAIAMRLYAQIAGENVLDGAIVANKIPNIIIGDKLMTQYGAVNKGNLDFYVTGSMKVVDFWSHKVLYDDTETAEPMVMFPETTRYLANEWAGIGLFNVTQNVSLLEETSTEMQTVLILPVWIVVLVGLMVLGAIAWIFKRIFSKR